MAHDPVKQKRLNSWLNKDPGAVPEEDEQNQWKRMGMISIHLHEIDQKSMPRPP